MVDATGGPPGSPVDSADDYDEGRRRARTAEPRSECSGTSGAAADTSSPPGQVRLISATPLTAGTAQLVWQRDPHATGYTLQRMRNPTQVADEKSITAGDQTVATWPDLPTGEHCCRVVAVNPRGVGRPSDQRCVTLGAAQSPGNADPVQGYYVIYGPPTPTDDEASQGAAERLLAELQAAGVNARLLDSRQSQRIADGENGFWVVVPDGFPSQAAAADECAQHRDIAPDCHPVG
jgi:hypothetical protein